MKPLFIPLKTEYFRQFQNGTKTVEYRLHGPRWHSGTCIPGRAVTLSHGYSGERIKAVVVSLSIICNNITDIYPRGSELAAIRVRIQKKR